MVGIDIAPIHNVSTGDDSWGTIKWSTGTTSITNKVNTNYQVLWADADTSYTDAKINEKQWNAYIKRMQKALEYRIWNQLDASTCGGSIWKNYTGGICDNGSSDYYAYKSEPVVVPTAQERLREMMRARQAPLVVGTRKALRPPRDERELRARQTLRRLVGEEQYRKFLAHGFITVRAKSGKVYKIHPGHGMTSVYSPFGKPIEKLCVVLAGDFPPTDSLITRYLMILNDEEHFRSFANVFGPPAVATHRKQEDRERQLPEIFKALKLNAA